MMLRQPTLDPSLLGAVALGHALLLGSVLFLRFATHSPELQAPMVVRLVSSDKAQQRTSTATAQIKPKAPILTTDAADAQRTRTREPTQAQPEPVPAAKHISKSDQDSSAPPAPAAITPPQFQADYLNNPAPEYPPLSRRLQEEGRVLLRVQVGADGTAQSVEVQSSSGFDHLDSAARRAVLEWRFVPAQQFGRPISASVLVPVVFSIRD